MVVSGLVSCANTTQYTASTRLTTRGSVHGIQVEGILYVRVPSSPEDHPCSESR